MGVVRARAVGMHGVGDRQERAMRGTKMGWRALRDQPTRARGGPLAFDPYLVDTAAKRKRECPVRIRRTLTRAPTRLCAPNDAPQALGDGMGHHGATTVIQTLTRPTTRAQRARCRFLVTMAPGWAREHPTRKRQTFEGARGPK